MNKSKGAVVKDASKSPRCARCRNHGALQQLRGHKQFCPWKECCCAKCILVEERRRVMREQIALRRRQDHETLQQEWDYDESSSLVGAASSNQKGNKRDYTSARKETTSKSQTKTSHLQIREAGKLSTFTNKEEYLWSKATKLYDQLDLLTKLFPEYPETMLRSVLEECQDFEASIHALLKERETRQAVFGWQPPPLRSWTPPSVNPYTTEILDERFQAAMILASLGRFSIGFSQSSAFPIQSPITVANYHHYNTVNQYRDQHGHFFSAK